MVSRFLLAVSLCVCAAFAQSAAGVGTISGQVRDASGSVVPNAKVVVANPSRGITRNMTTNDAGVFTAGALPPAAGYQVTVTSQGFNTWEVRDADLAVGQNLNLNVMLGVATATTTLDVTAEAPLVESSKTDVSTVIGQKQIEELPINGRRVDSFALLAPGVSADGNFGLLSFRGVAGGNSFLVDGNDTTETFFNENAGRTRIASQLSQDAVQEFQVLSANFAAEYGRAMGGVVNTVTKSGSNDLHGTAFWFFRNRTLNARDRYASTNPPEYRHQMGASLGGKIIKDKLFYFLNTEIQRRSFPIASSVVRPGVVQDGKWVRGGAQGCGAPATPAQCDALDTLLPRLFGTIPRRNDQELAFGKIDYRPGERNTFSASFNFLHFVAPNGIQSAAAITTGAAITNNANDSVRTRNGRLSWVSIPNSSMVNEARFNWFTDRQADDFNSGLIPPGLGLLQLSVGGQALGGGANYLPRIEPNENRYGFADNLAWTKGKHTIKFGADIARTRDYEYFIFNAFGSYSYASSTLFALDFTGNTTGAKNWSTYSQGFGSPIIDISLKDAGFFAQDQWRLTPNLTVNYGIRYEHTWVPQPKVTNPDYPQTGHIPVSNLQFMPRLGVAYSFNDQKTVLRAGYGVFFSRYQNGLISNLYQNNAVLQPSVSLSGGNPAQLASGPVYPNILAGSSFAKNGTTVQFAAPNMRAPYSEQATFAVERQITKTIGLTTSYIWSRGLQLLGVNDLNVGPLGAPVTYNIANAGGQIVGSYTTPTYRLANRVDTRYNRVLQAQNGMNSYYNALVVDVKKRFKGGFTASLAYTWSHEIDYGVGGGSSNLFYSSATTTFNDNFRFDKGSGALDQRQRFSFSFVEQPTFTHRSGAFYKYVVNNWQISAITTLATGRVAVPTVTISDTTPFAGAAFTNSLNGYGGWFRVPFYGTDIMYTPNTYRADARISKLLPITERMRAYLNFEVFNLTNTITDTGVFTQAFSERGGILSPTPNLGQGNASGGFPDGTNARRAQVSARLVF
jgi:Carboxypeptidase regulatory-like domain/TonB dependent receptor-like, beta-barrel/TonB-dependent Receptor Plug Domain